MEINDGSGRDFSKIREVLQKLIGDTKQEEGVMESMSPIDFLPVNEMASLGLAGAKGLGRALVEGSPRHLSNQIGSIGKNIMAKPIAEGGNVIAIKQPPKPTKLKLQQTYENHNLGKDMVAEGDAAVQLENEIKANPEKFRKLIDSLKK